MVNGITNRILSFKNNPDIKKQLIERMNWHIERDNLKQGLTGQDGKGCTVWCALNGKGLEEDYDHEAFSYKLGLPVWLAHLQDTIFEGLYAKDAKEFSSEWVKAIPVGKDLTPVKWQMTVYILKSILNRLDFLEIPEHLIASKAGGEIKNCIRFFENAIKTGSHDGVEAILRTMALGELIRDIVGEGEVKQLLRCVPKAFRNEESWIGAFLKHTVVVLCGFSDWRDRAMGYKIYADKLILLLKNA